ncbi:MAG: MotA/TolQ/ExbB proton channel family protein [Lentisphaeria bacterium]|jgi:biopolymer transport protein ExbB
MNAFLAELLRECQSYLRAGGWLMLPLALISIWIWLLYLLLLCRLREAVKNNDPQTLGLDGDLRSAGRLAACERRCAELAGAVPRMIVHAIARVRAGQSPEAAFAQCQSMELGEYRSGMFGLSALVAAAPLVGLLGTVLGMIQTFTAVSLRNSDVTGMVADGISMALITTQAGLVAALAGTFGLAHLFSRYQHLVNQVYLCGAGFLRGLGAGGAAPDGSDVRTTAAE